MKLKRNNELYAVILAGGPGERFWPASRLRNPKYAMELTGPRSMIEETVRRLTGLIQRKNILIVTTAEQVAVLKKKLKKVKGNVSFLIEPYPKDTAAAIALAAAHIKRKNPEAIMAVFPADHYIRGEKAFRATIRKAMEAALGNSLATLGIRPTAPRTGYGYIKARRCGSYYKVDKFIEKPDKKTAERFFKDRRYFWNSGIFVWKVGTILDSLKEYMPGLYRIVTRGGGNLKREYKKLKKISIDYGVMEKAKNRVMIPAKFTWSDLGSWLSLDEIYKKDSSKNANSGLVVNHNTKDSVIVGPSNYLIAASGVRNLVIVHTKDATLVADKTRPQDIKRLVAIIRKKGLRRFL